MDMRAVIQFMAKGMRGHLQPLKIEEDEEKITITMKPCGSGERIIEKGGYEAGLARVKAASPHHLGYERLSHLLRPLPGRGDAHHRGHGEVRSESISRPIPCAMASATSPSTRTPRRYPRSSTNGSEKRSRHRKISDATFLPYGVRRVGRS